MRSDIAASDLVLNADTLIKIIDKIPHIVYLKDSSHRFLLANKACVQMLGAEGKDLVGKTDQDFYNPDYADYIHNIELMVVRNGEKVVVPEERFTDPAGTTQIMKTIRLPFFIPEMEEIGVLGISVNMAKEKEMENAIRTQNIQLRKQKEEIEQQKKDTEELYHKLKNGLRISKFIQDAILPSDASIKRHLPDSFILYQPKEVACGDFYWFHNRNNMIYLATIDCTEFDAGGTFIAMICYDLLSEIIKTMDKPSPAEMLHALNEGLKNSLEQSIDISKMKERVYINICALDIDKFYLEYAGAGSPLLLINKANNQMVEPSVERHGLPFDSEKCSYTDSRIRTKKGDVVYIMTDGFAIQKSVGGDRKESFGYGRLKEIINSIHGLPMNQQREILLNALAAWRGEEEQADDVIMIGFRL